MTIETPPRTMLHAALLLAEQGYPVFPIMPGRKAPPLTPEGFKNASQAEDIIAGWWTGRPDANVAIATAGLCALDVDGADNPWLASLTASQLADLERAPLARTPRGGRHYIFHQDGTPIASSQGHFAEHVDIKADGGYLMVAPSHADYLKDGNRIVGDYRWVVDLEPRDQLPVVPEWLERLCNGPPRRKEPGAANGTGTTNGDAFNEGERNGSLFQLGCKLRRAGCDLDMIVAALDSANRTKCKPPLDDEEVRTIAESAAKGRDGAGETTEPRAAVTVCLADVEPTQLEWLWPGKMALGKLTMISGDPGTGKSNIALNIAARISTGAPWPDDPHRGQPVGSVLLLTAEDDAADTIVPRLKATGADLSKIHILEAVEVYESDRKGKVLRSFALNRDVEAMIPVIDRLADLRLIVLDPISCYLGAKVDSHKNADSRDALRPITELAAKRAFAVLPINHNSKGGGSALHRSQGSIAFVAACRACFAVCRDKADPERRLFLPTKNNLAKDTQGLAYRIESDYATGAPVIVWEDGPVNITADEAMAPDDHPDQRGAMVEAMEWLQEILADGAAVAVAELKKSAVRDGFAWRTVERAKNEMKLDSRRAGFGGQGAWSWRLPPNTATDEWQP